MIDLAYCQQRDAADPLRPLRDQFSIPPGLIYLDGNSLGAMPRSAAARAAQVVSDEWGQGLIGSWNTAGWFDLPMRLGNRIAPLIGAAENQVVVTDSTSINLYKVLFAAIAMQRADQPQRRVIVSERSNFPTDLYIAEGLCRAHDCELRLVEAEAIPAALNSDLAVLLLTHVNYRTGAMHDMAALTAAAHAAGARVVWDLAHSAGAVPVDLLASDADFAIGCGYKYLNGGPGAPAFVWVNPRHADRFWQPLSGWWGHAAPFAFTPGYEPAAGIQRYLCGTQPVLSLAVLECGLDTLHAATALGGMQALRAKSLALGDLFIELIEQRCDGCGLALVTPREHALRGSQISLTHNVTHNVTQTPDSGTGSASSGYAIVQALIGRGVVGDFRAGDGQQQADILRFGFAPLYIGFEDLWNAVEHLRDVLHSGAWQAPQFRQKQAVT